MPTPESPIKWATAEGVLRSTKKHSGGSYRSKAGLKEVLASMPSGSTVLTGRS